MTTLALICGWISVLVLTALAIAFWTDPERGMRQTTHRVERLPWVMAYRYTAFAVLGVAITLRGDLLLLAVFFAICGFMGFADGRIYASAGHPHVKHTISGILSLIALTVTLIALMGKGAV